FSNMYDMLLQECVSKDVMCSYLQSSSDLDEITELQYLYLHKVRECDYLAQKLSEQTEFEREQYFKIHDLKAQLQDKNIAISELKKLIEKCKGKSVNTKFDKPSVVRKLNAQRIPKPSVLGKPTPFSDSLERKYFPKKKSVSKTNESEGLSKPVTPQNLPKTATQTSVTACNDSLNSRTLNVNAVCATCGKCVFNLNHDACVSKFLNDVNARTKKPNVVPISTRKPKSQANKSVATPHKKTVASESTTTNSKSYYRMLYKKTSKAWKWWIAQQCPSAYKWVPKTKKKWVPKVRNESVTKKVSFAIDNVSRITNVLKLTNTLGSNLSCIPSSSNSLADCTVCFAMNQFVQFLVQDLFKEIILSTRVLLPVKETTSQLQYSSGLSITNSSMVYGIEDILISLRLTTLLSKKDLLIGLPKLKYVKDQLCSSCEVSKAKRSSFKSKTVPSSKGQYTWTLFLRSKDETPKVLKDFLMMIQRNLQAPIIYVRTDRGTEFLNKTLNAFFKEEGIEHQTSTPRTPKQNGVVERQNHTLVEAARTMLSASKLPLFF
ncbi:retrovirus-related pol polyprotein from transposon TNT 1-94, partial [Tanacetum coccineum]